MSKKHAILAAAAATLAIGAGVGTFAAFSDSATSGPVTAGAGTLHLGNGITANSEWQLTNVAPGQELGAKVFTITNGGTLNGNLDLLLTATGTPDTESANGIEGQKETGTPTVVTPESELPKNLTAKISLTIDGTTQWLVGDAGTFAPLNVVDDNTSKFEVLDQALAGGKSGELSVTLAVADAGNELQGDGADLKLEANLTQA